MKHPKCGVRVNIRRYVTENKCEHTYVRVSIRVDIGIYVVPVCGM